ncbi:MAG: hypothetical protein K2W78_08565 [Xanthobacteraceae bacterium]|nr:hypothetical protein [Xanthobacteraceae bacterium]
MSSYLDHNGDVAAFAPSPNGHEKTGELMFARAKRRMYALAEVLRGR